MIKNIKNLIPEDIVNTYKSLSSLRQSNEEWIYEFVSDEDFQRIGNQDLSQAAEIYWKEMLARVHIVCLVSSFKTLR